MTAAPATTNGKARTVLRRVLAILVVLGLTLGSGLTYCSADWKSSVVKFDLAGGDYRLRLTGSGGGECARLERETNFDEFTRWRSAGEDCAWPRVGGGDGWLAGGQAVRLLIDGGGQSDDWIFFGIVPAAAAEVVLTLDDGRPRRLSTLAAGKGEHRLYALHQPGIGDRAEVVGIALRDAQGGEIRVY